MSENEARIVQEFVAEIEAFFGTSWVNFLHIFIYFPISFLLIFGCGSPNLLQIFVIHEKRARPFWHDVIEDSMLRKCEHATTLATGIQRKNNKRVEVSIEFSFEMSKGK